MFNTNNENYPKISQKEFVVLGLLISRGELYGLEIVEASKGEIKRGTVYVTLGRMVEKGFVESREESRVEPEIGIARRIYRVTGLGEMAFKAQRKAYEGFVGELALGGLN